MKRVVIFFSFLSAVCVSACSSNKMTLIIEPMPSVNEGRPFRVVIEDVNRVTFEQATYETVAARALSSEEPVLALKTIYPCTEKCDEPLKIEVERPKDEMIGLFFLFTDRDGGEWRRLVGPPLPRKLELKLEDSHIVDANGS